MCLEANVAAAAAARLVLTACLHAPETQRLVPGAASSFEVDLRCHLDGALWMEGAAQRFAARGGSVSLRAKVQLAEAERWRWRWGPSRRVPQATNLTLSNVRVALHAVHTGGAKDDTQMQHSMEARLCKVARAKLAARLGDTLTLRLGAGEPTPVVARQARAAAGPHSAC